MSVFPLYSHNGGCTRQSLWYSVYAYCMLVELVNYNISFSPRTAYLGIFCTVGRTYLFGSPLAFENFSLSLLISGRC